eukprot:scaffold116_cov233-Pinguiococcus_pyrenoidosus.AAC.7
MCFTPSAVSSSMCSCAAASSSVKMVPASGREDWSVLDTMSMPITPTSTPSTSRMVKSSILPCSGDVGPGSMLAPTMAVLQS